MVPTPPPRSATRSERCRSAPAALVVLTAFFKRDSERTIVQYYCPGTGGVRYHASWDTEPELAPSEHDAALAALPDFARRWGDFRNCVWPRDLFAAATGRGNHGRDDRECGGGEEDVTSLDSTSTVLADLFARLNDAVAADAVAAADGGGGGAAAAATISFSHFLPRQELLPEKRFLREARYALATAVRHDHTFAFSAHRSAPQTDPPTARPPPRRPPCPTPRLAPRSSRRRPTAWRGAACASVTAAGNADARGRLGAARAASGRARALYIFLNQQFF